MTMAPPLMPVAAALEQILAGAMTLEPEDVGLRFALGRTLAAPVTATLSQPPFDSSAMDGYAVRACDTLTATAKLRLIGESAAGRPFEGAVGEGEAVSIFTGAAMPAGADAVLIQENAFADGTCVSVLSPVSPGDNVRPLGNDFREHDTLISRGERLTPRDILLAASAGHATVSVVRKPVVAILATGNELVEPGESVGPGQIVCSNSYGLAALVDAAGGAPHIVGIADDDEEDLVDALRAGDGADILVTTGGASVGRHDLVRPALERIGARLEFYRIAMRPGKPLFFGSRAASGKTQRCLGLPGNPGAALITARVFLVPLIAMLLGRQSPLGLFDAILGAPVAANGPRDHYMRATIDRSVLPPRVTPIPDQDSARVLALRNADCLVIIPAGAPALAAGARVEALHIDF